MARRPSPSGSPPAKPRRAKALPAVVATASTRIDRLVAIIDHCTAAKDTTDELGEKFLSYLLAMAIQESRTAMRRIPVDPGD